MKILKFIVLGGMVLLLGITGLRGSETRIVSMGYYANFYVRDSYNIWGFPSTLVGYRSKVFIDSYYPEYGLWRGGIHIPVAETFTLGVYLDNTTYRVYHADTKFTDPFGMGFGRDMYYHNLDADEAAHQFTLFGGLRLTNVDVAIFGTSYSSKFSFEDPDDSDNNFEDKLGWRAFGVGIGTKVNERTRFEGTILYHSGDFDHVLPNAISPDTLRWKQPLDYNGYGGAVRVFYAYSPRVIFVPFGSYLQSNEGYRWLVEGIDKKGLEEQNIKTYVDKYTEYILGLGVDLIPDDNNLITLAGGMEIYSSTDTETWYSGTPPVAGKYTYRSLPFVSVGLESSITKWLTARFSFYELLETWEGQEPSPGDEKILTKGRLTGSTYAARFGLAFRLGRFTIDTLVDTDHFADFLHNGPYILSGNKHEKGLFSQLTVTYNFGEKE